MIRGSKTFKSGKVYAVRVAVDRCFSAARLASMPCQAMGAGRAARGDRKSGADGCRGAS